MLCLINGTRSRYQKSKGLQQCKPFFVDFSAPSCTKPKGGISGSTPKTGASPFSGHFSDRFLNNSPAISAAQNAHSQPIIFEITEAIRTPLDQLHFTVKTFCDAVISGKPEHSGHFFPPIMQRLTQGAQWREGRFSKVINFI